LSHPRGQPQIHLCFEVYAYDNSREKRNLFENALERERPHYRFLVAVPESRDRIAVERDAGAPTSCRNICVTAKKRVETRSFTGCPISRFRPRKPKAPGPADHFRRPANLNDAQAAICKRPATCSGGFKPGSAAIQTQNQL
jgi:hypothetical protein